MHSNSYLKSKNTAYTFNSEIDFEKISATQKKSQRPEPARQKLNPVAEREVLSNKMAEAAGHSTIVRDIMLTTVLSEQSQQSNPSSNLPEFLCRKQEGQVGQPQGKASQTARHPSGVAITARRLYYQVAGTIKEHA